MKSTKRFLAFLLCFAMLLPFVPADVFAVEHEAYTLDNGYIRVNVSKVNGGFTVNTAEGSQLRKADIN